MNKPRNPFVVENLRTTLAKEKEYKKLLKTYSTKYSEIKDLNTPNLWDELHYNTAIPEVSHPMAEDRLKIVSNFILGKNISVLDIGFGSASLERVYFQKHLSKNISWCGIEISSLLVKKAKKVFSHCAFTVGNILKLNYPKNTFDYVIALEVLEHIRPSKLFQSLHEIYRVIKPGKYIIVSVPLNEGLETMIAKGENPNAHVRTYAPELIKAELEIVGFKLLKERKLFAFHNYYRLKTFIANYVWKKKFSYNNIILFAQKSAI